MAQLESEYIKTGKLRYVVRDFPLEAIHPQAFRAAEATHCGRDQGKYWEMHHQLFANQRSLAVDDLPGHAQAVGLDVPAFQRCLDSNKHAVRVRADLAEGQRAGISGTPTFFLGAIDGDSKMKVVRTLRGAQPYAAFKAAIDSVLSTQK